MSAVFTIGETDFDDLDDEEFLSEACNFESISCNNAQKGNFTNNIDRNGSVKNYSGTACSSKQTLLRSKGSSVNSFADFHSFPGGLKPSINSKTPNNDLTNTSLKRAEHFSKQCSSEPPLKRPNCVKENYIPTSERDQSFNFPRITTEDRWEPTNGKVFAEAQRSNNDGSNVTKGVNFNSGVTSRPMSNLSNGLRYTQNMTSILSSPRLTNDEMSNLARASMPELRMNSLARQQRTPEINSTYPSTPNRYTNGESQNVVGSTILPQTSRQTPELRGFAKESSNHPTIANGSEKQGSFFNNKRTSKANSLPPSTPNKYTQKDSSMGKLRSTMSPSVSSENRRTTVLRGFARDSPVHGTGGTPAAEGRCITPRGTRRFPGPAGILPRLEPDQSLDNLPSPLAETPRKKSPKVCQLVSSDSDEDFSIEPWTVMQAKVGKEFPDSLDSLASVIRKAASHQLEKGKVAFLAVLVKSFHPTGLDVSIVLKDPSGEMRGTLHRKVLEQQQVELGPGCGLFLKQVSIFSPSPRKHYLNITPGNILEIFPSSADQCSSQKKFTEDAPIKHDVKETEKQIIRSNQSKEVEAVYSVEETNFDDLLAELDEDDDMLVEAMNF